MLKYLTDNKFMLIASLISGFAIPQIARHFDLGFGAIVGMLFGASVLIGVSNSMIKEKKTSV